MGISVLALSPGFVVPVLAVSCPDNGSLTQGNVSPSSGTTNTDFHFTVVYQDDLGETPSLIQVIFDGANGRRLFPESGDLQTGRAYGRVLQRPVGTWTITFVVDPGTDNVNTTCQVSGGTITVSAPATPTPTPTPVPTPTPKPTAAPTPKPSPTPTPKPTAAPTPEPAKATPKPTMATPKLTAKPAKTEQPTANPTLKTAAGVSPDPSPSGVGSVAGASPSPTRAAALPRPTTSPAAGAGVTSGSGGSDGTGGGGLDAVLGVVTNPVLAWLVATAGGLALFLFLMRRRSREAGLDGTLLMATSLAAAHTADAVPVSTPSPALAIAAAPAVAKPASPLAKAAGKSKTTGTRVVAATDLTNATKKPVSVAQTFSKPTGKGVERLKVGYRMVRLSEGVDDVGSRELGRLDRGDEIEVLGSWEGYLQVRTPAGVTGWIPRHTILG